MRRPGGLVIAIDGVVGAGKSTTARRVAQRLGYRHLDTGAMYRAVTLAAIRRGVAADDSAGLARLLESLCIELEPQDQGGRVLMDGEDVTQLIRKPEISRQVGAYADAPLVRRALVAQQQRLGERGGVVAEGRDVGTVVFPDADLKIAMTADLDERVRRRHRELLEKGVRVSLAELKEDIEARDRQDATRDYGAPGPPAKVLALDTTLLRPDEQVERIVSLARALGA
jgi:cytidylate kinase